MTKKQLLKKLEKVNDNTEIILASDAEGNSYDKLSDIDLGVMGLRFSLDYDNGHPTLFDCDDVNSGDITKKEYIKMKKCIVLYPN